MDAALTSYYRVSFGNASDEILVSRVSQVTAEISFEETQSGNSGRVRTSRGSALATRLRLEMPITSQAPKSLVQWWDDVRDGGKPLRKNLIDVYLQDGEGATLKRWRFTNCWPCKMGVAPFSDSKASAGYVAIWEFVFEGVEDLSGSGASAKPSSAGSPRRPGPNAAEHSRYVKDLRRGMEKPHADNPELKRIIDSNYRTGAKIGSGSTADAIRYEKENPGARVGDRSHAQKGRETVERLKNWEKNNPHASPGDRAAAENVRKDLSDALWGKG